MCCSQCPLGLWLYSVEVGPTTSLSPNVQVNETANSRGLVSVMKLSVKENHQLLRQKQSVNFSKKDKFMPHRETALSFSLWKEIRRCTIRTWVSFHLHATHRAF